MLCCMSSINSRALDARRARLNERMRRLKASTVALTVAAAFSLWWLVGGAVAATQGTSQQAVGTTDTPAASAADNQAPSQFFAGQQPSLGSGGGTGSSTLRSGGS
jgi:hypothetical protein